MKGEQPRKRFMDKFEIDEKTGCWIWTASRDKDGYGFLKFRGKQDKAHRVAWVLYRGEIPAGLIVCHTCDNPPCVNPEHLFIGTQKDNAMDKVGKNRSCYGERVNTSKLNPTTVIRIRQLYKTGKYSQDRLAKLFGVYQSTIGRIVRGDTWKRVGVEKVQNNEMSLI